MCPSCGHWRKIQQYFGLGKTFLVSRSLPRLGLRATCWNYKISQCVVLKTKRQAIIKNQNKIFHSHWDKRHKFPLRIDPLAARRQTIQKKLGHVERVSAVPIVFGGTCGSRWLCLTADLGQVSGHGTLRDMGTKCKTRIRRVGIGLSIVIYWLILNVSTPTFQSSSR